MTIIASGVTLSLDGWQSGEIPDSSIQDHPCLFVGVYFLNNIFNGTQRYPMVTTISMLRESEFG